MAAPKAGTRAPDWNGSYATNPAFSTIGSDRNRGIGANPTGRSEMAGPIRNEFCSMVSIRDSVRRWSRFCAIRRRFPHDDRRQNVVLIPRAHLRIAKYDLTARYLQPPRLPHSCDLPQVIRRQLWHDSGEKESYRGHTAEKKSPKHRQAARRFSQFHTRKANCNIAVRRIPLSADRMSQTNFVHNSHSRCHLSSLTRQSGRSAKPHPQAKKHSCIATAGSNRIYRSSTALCHAIDRTKSTDIGL